MSKKKLAALILGSAVVIATGAWLGLSLSGCGGCASGRDDWLALTKRSTACTVDSDCILVGQSSSCDCSPSIAGDGVAVNGVTYRANGGEAMLDSYYTTCTPPTCCDCAPASVVGCVHGQCTIVRHGCCGCAPDGGARTRYDSR